MTREDNTLNSICYVYAIRDLANHNVKIGMSNNIEKRMSLMQTSTSGVLEIVKRWECSTRQSAKRLETDLHEKFINHRIRGEWFEPKVSELIGKTEVPAVRSKSVVVIDPERAAKLSLPSGAWQVLMSMAKATSNLGFVDVTQLQMANELGFSERTIAKHVSKLKQNRVVFRERNKNGRMKFRINPEYIWDFKLAIRNDLVADIRHAKLNKKAAA